MILNQKDKGKRLLGWGRSRLEPNSNRNSQQDATVYQNLLFHVYMKLNMFRATHRPSSGAQNCTSSLWLCIRERLLNVVVAGRCQRPATTLPRQRQIAVTVWQIPDAVDTVVCAPDDGWRYHPKHVEQFPDKINCATLHLVGYILQ